MKIDGSGFAALIMSSIAIGSIISPIAQSWVNNHYKTENKKSDNELAAKKIELTNIAAQRSHIKAIFENYVKYTGEVIATQGQSGVSEQGSYFGQILLYLPPKVNLQVIELQQKIYDQTDYGTIDEHFQRARNEFGGLTQSLKRELDRLLEEKE